MAVQPYAAPTNSLPPTQQVDYTALLKALQAAPNYAGLAKSAGAQAGQETAATVQGLRAQQDQINRQAAVRAQQIDAATLAAANQLTGLHLADRLGAGLRSSAHDIEGLASGYSGQLQQTVGDAGAELARHLSGLGAPGGVPSTAAQAGNVLYGLGGALPANELLTDAPFVEAAARALPGETLGYGQQQAAGALGQGAEQAAQLNPQIAAAYAKLPALQRSILTDLQSQAAKARQDAIANTFKALSLQQQGFTAEATRVYRQAQIDAQTAKAQTDAYYKGVAAAQAGQRIDQTSAHNTALESAATTRNDLESARVNNDVTKYNNSQIPVLDASRTNSVHYQVDQFGHPILGADGKLQPQANYRLNKAGTGVVKIPSAKPAAAGAGPSKTAYKNAIAFAKGLTGVNVFGVKLSGPDAPHVTYWDALDRVRNYLITAGYKDAAAQKAAPTILNVVGFAQPPSAFGAPVAAAEGVPAGNPFLPTPAQRANRSLPFGG